MVFLLSILILCACRSRSDSMDSTRAKWSCIPCNIKEIDEAEEEKEKIKTVQIEKVLCTIKKECQTNIEFTEYSNRILFDILRKHTNTFVKSFSKVPLSDREYLLHVISNPLLDYNIKEIALKVESSKGVSSPKIWTV